MEARLAKCRADAVERAGREGRRDFNRGPGADREATAAVVRRGDENAREKEWTKSAVGPSDATRSSARSTRRGGDCASCS